MRATRHLIRVTGNRQLPVLRALPDGSWISRVGPVELRVIRCEITVTTTDGTRRTEHYLLVTTVLDPSVPAADLIHIQHDRSGAGRLGHAGGRTSVGGAGQDR